MHCSFHFLFLITGNSKLKETKKILINATYSGRRPTGVGIFTDELVSRLIKVSPGLFYLIGIKDLDKDFRNKKIVSKYYSPEYGAKGHISRMLWSQTALACEFKRSGCDLIFSTLPEAPVIIRNKVVVVHDIIPVRFSEIQPGMKNYFKYIVPSILKTSLHLVFDSEYTRRDVLDYYNLKDIPNSVIPAGYDCNQYYPFEKGFIKKKYGYDRYFFYIGDMRP